MPEKTTTKDDPRTRRRRQAEAAYELATGAMEAARTALDDPQSFTTGLELLRDAYVAHGECLHHAGELRSKFHRRAIMALADRLHRDLATLWQKATDTAQELTQWAPL